MDGLRRRFFILMIAAIAGLGGFLFGFDSSVIADTKDQIVEQFSLSDFQWSLIVSVSLLGSLVGIPISGLFADRISRRTMLSAVALGFICGAILCAQSTTLPMLIAGRFIIGVCIGIASYISPLFIAEMSPPSIRGGMVLMNGLAITFGQAFSFLVGYFLHDISASSWRALLWMGTIPAMCLLMGILFIPHSPRWILGKYGYEKARDVLRKLRDDENTVTTELNEIEATLNKSQEKIKLTTLLKSPLSHVLLVGLTLGMFQQFSGINALMYYGPVIFESAGFHPIKSAILATFWMGLLNFIFTGVTLLLVDRLGRRFLLLTGSFVASLGLLLVGFYYHLELFDYKWLMFASMAAYIVGYCVSVGSLFWVIISEIYPLKVRGLAMSIATVMQWCANLMVSISFLSVFKNYGTTNTFWLFSSICLLCFIFVYYFVPETTGISLEKIEENLAAGKKMRELGRPIQEDVTEPVFAADLKS